MSHRFFSRRERRKPVGQLLSDRRRHIARQRSRDQLRKLRHGEVVELKAFVDSRLRKVRVRPLEDDEPSSGQRILCRFGRQLRVMTYVWKDGEKVMDGSRCAFIPPRQWYGVVLSEGG